MTEPRDDQRPALLAANADGYARTALATVSREYPNDLHHAMRGPEDRPLPHEVHPAFYGSYDWHSCVEMHWTLVRLLRLRPDSVPAEEIRTVLNQHLTPENLAVEAAYFDTHRGFKRPYGWGWALTLAQELHELSESGDSDAATWSTAMEPLADTIHDLYLAWLPKATYPERNGVHSNSAFGLSRAWSTAEARAGKGDHRLLTAITDAALRWFAADTDYPAAWEPSGSDFLSPALVEAELMTHVLPGHHFESWFDRFLPKARSGEPKSLLTPAVVSDSTDGQIAHLHGLNLCRAWAWRRIAGALGLDVGLGLGTEQGTMTSAAEVHAAAALDAATGGDYMVEHWLACYAVLYLTEGM